MNATLANFDSFYEEVKKALLNDFKKNSGLQTIIQRFEKVN